MEGVEVAEAIDPEATLPPQRRSADARLDRLMSDVHGVQGYVERMNMELSQNTQITFTNARQIAEMQGAVVEMKVTVDQVRDIVTSMRVFITVAKWAGYLAAAAGSIFAAWKQLK